MPDVLVFATQKDAQDHLRALGRSSAFTEKGRPRLPRCDCAKWGDRQIRSGRRVKADCPCVTRDAPVPECPYITVQATLAYSFTGGEYAVIVSDAHDRGRGDVITIDGKPITIDASGKRQLTDPESRRPRAVLITLIGPNIVDSTPLKGRSRG